MRKEKSGARKVRREKWGTKWGDKSGSKRKEEAQEKCDKEKSGARKMS